MRGAVIRARLVPGSAARDAPGSARETRPAATVVAGQSGPVASGSQVRRIRISLAPVTTPHVVTPAEQALIEEALPSRRISLGRREWIVMGSMFAFVLLLHIVGWGTLIGIVAPQGLSVGNGAVFGIGLGVTAYTLGMRHAFDADHIAAIDNTTRKLLTDGQKPVSVGFWFSLGHSSIVFGLCFLLSIGVKSLVGQVENGDSTLQNTLGLIGTSVSGTFLILIGLINLVVLVKIWQVFQGMKDGDFDEVELDHHLSKRGFMNRLLGGVTKAVRKPRHMYPVGLLFGLGFDTATEVSLLVLAGGAAAFSLPWYAILCLPILFAAGMSLLDSIDGVFMIFAYGWAFSQPVRKIYYNIVITGLSVLRVGTTLLDLEFERSGETTSCRVAKKRGNLRVVIEA